MSKLYDKFSSLKNSNKDTFYLFKIGIFFIAYDHNIVTQNVKVEELLLYKIS